MAETKSQPVLFEERRTDNGARAGVARLNVEKSLNSLSLEMIDLLSERLSAWVTDPAIAFVILEAAGEKALFCAGATFTAFTEPCRRLPSACIPMSAVFGCSTAHRAAVAFFLRSPAPGPLREQLDLIGELCGYATLPEMTPEWLEGFFASPWQAHEHPLADLGA